MPRFKATKNGPVQFTEQEESEFDARETEFLSVANKKKLLREKINLEKFDAESKGVVVNDVRYSIDFATRSELANAYVYLSRNQDRTYTVNPKNDDPVELDFTSLGIVYDAVNLQSNLVAEARKSHFAAIKELTKNNVDSYDVKSLWP